MIFITSNETYWPLTGYPMKTFKLILFILGGCFAASFSLADIYEWTDENGITHYTNQTPPLGSKILMIAKEEPYDEAADRKRMEADRQERLELARLEIAQREAELELRQVEAERRLAEADRLVQEAIRENDYYLYETSSRNWAISRTGGYGCRDDRWDCNYLDYNRWYYRKGYRQSTQPDKRYLRTPYQRYPYIKKPYGSGRKLHYNRYRGRVRPSHTTRNRQKRHYPTYQWNSRSTHNYNFYRGSNVGSGSGISNRRGNFSRGRSGFGMRR
jgi:hypothetical protein